jgi:hypothetical protein
MILAVAKLEQSLLGHRPIAIRCRAIDPHPFWLEVVDSDDLPVQARFKLLPLLVIDQSIQYNGQAVIAPEPILHLLSRAALQRLPPMGYPGLYLIHAMVAFRQDVCQPNCRRPAQADPLPVSMWLEVLIQQLCYAHHVTLSQQYWYIVHSFCRYVQLFCHADSLSHFQMVVTI